MDICFLLLLLLFVHIRIVAQQNRDSSTVPRLSTFRSVVLVPKDEFISSQTSSMAQNNNTRKTKKKQHSGFLPETVEELVQYLGLIPHPEGGYFRETFRSGSIPMTTRGCKDLAVPARDMVLVVRKEKEGAAVVGGDDTVGNNADNDDYMVRRNCLTSIFWVPTVDSPKLFMSQNRSDHVHYYQGGAPFEYIVFRPSMEDRDSGRWTRTILGPDLRRGHVLQLPVEGGCYKCGRLLLSSSSDQQQEQEEDNDIDDNDYPPYSIIAEAVAPGFDVHDFNWVTAAQLTAATGGGRDDDVMAMSLQEYVKELSSGVILEEGNNNGGSGSSAADHFDPFYDALPPPPQR
jgi:uncharacterized protein